MEGAVVPQLPKARSLYGFSYASTLASMQVFESELSAVLDVEQGLDVLERLADDLGYHRLAYHRRTLRNAVPRQSWYRQFPNGWESLWARYARNNPVLRTSFASNLPFSWDEIAASPDHPLEVHTLRYLRQYGIEHAITAPVHHGDGAVSTISFICAPDDPCHPLRIAHTRNSVLLGAHLFVSRIEDLLGHDVMPADKGEDTFNTREQECLHWASLGKTTGEMATIMGISENTVKVYFRRIFARLDVKTRPQAISEAKRRGLLQ